MEEPRKGQRVTMRDWDGSRITGVVSGIHREGLRRTIISLRVEGDALGPRLRHLPIDHMVGTRLTAQTNTGQ